MRLLIIAFSLIYLLACNSEDRITYIDRDELIGQVVADTIIYDVIIKDTNLNDYWAAHCLKGLNHSEFINSIFNDIYNDKLQPLHFLTEEEISIKEFKAMEQSDWFSRENIGKIQFSEIWYYKSDHSVMKKKVVSLTMGIEQYDNNNKLKGYKPLFKVYLN